MQNRNDSVPLERLRVPESWYVALANWLLVAAGLMALVLLGVAFGA